MTAAPLELGVGSGRFSTIYLQGNGADVRPHTGNPCAREQYVAIDHIPEATSVVFGPMGGEREWWSTWERMRRVVEGGTTRSI